MDKKPTIAFICDGIAEFTAGSVISTRRFALQLHARGHRIIFIAGRSPHHKENDMWEGMKVYRFASLLLAKTDGQFYMGFPTAGALRKIFKNEGVDIVHVAVPTPAAVAATLAARSLTIPIVIHSHTQPENLFLNAFHNRAQVLGNILSAIMYLYLNYFYAKAQIILFPTEFSRSLFKGLPKGMRTEVVSNGVDAARFAPRDPAPLFQKFKLDPSRTYLLYVGRLHPEKRVDTLIEAMPKIVGSIPTAHALIVGTGHREASLKDLAQNVGATSCVTFLGFLSDADVEAIYSAAQVFVLPSLVELEGMVVLQAMAARCAVLISDSPKSASPTLVKDNGLLFKAGDSADLAEKAIVLLKDPHLEAIRDRSLVLGKGYDIARSIDKVEGVYRSLLAPQV